MATAGLHTTGTALRLRVLGKGPVQGPLACAWRVGDVSGLSRLSSRGRHGRAGPRLRSAGRARDRQDGRDVSLRI